MAIVCVAAMLSRSFRTLMFPAAARLLSIKDLKDLIFFLSAFSIDMQVLTDLKRCFSRVRVFLSVVRGPVPRRAIGHTSVRGGNPLACACGMRGPPRYGSGKGFPLAPFGIRRSRTTDGEKRSRGTGPRATVDGAASYNRENRVNRANPAHFLLQTTGLAATRPQALALRCKV